MTDDTEPMVVEPLTWSLLEEPDKSLLAEAFVFDGQAALVAAPDPRVVLNMLYEKIKGLSSSMGALEGLLNVRPPLAGRARILEAHAQAADAKSFCDALYFQINYGGPFPAIPEGARDCLLGSLRRVARATAMSAGVDELLTAIDGLITAFPSRTSG